MLFIDLHKFIISLDIEQLTGVQTCALPIYLKDWNISKEIALHRSAWRLAINVPEP